jgi:hypothetical protein
MRAKAALLSFVGSLALIAPQSSPARQVAIPFNPANFSNPLVINNPLLTLVPGTTLVYRAKTPDGCEENRVTVTNDTKSIAAGVTARPIHDVVLAGECGGPLTLAEDTFDWFAQDNDGNVWYLGEDTKDCDENGCVQDPGSWEAGADVSSIGSLGRAGIIMLAHPRMGDQYQQEFYKDHAEDRGAVIGIDVDVTLTRPDAIRKLFHHCLETKERSTIEPGSVAHKFYCPNIGMVAEEDISRGRVRSELVDRVASALEFRKLR